MSPRFANNRERREARGLRRLDVELDELAVDALKVVRADHSSDNAAIRHALVESAVHTLLDQAADENARNEPIGKSPLEMLAMSIVYQLLDDCEHVGLPWLRLSSEKRATIERRWIAFVHNRLKRHSP